MAQNPDHTVLLKHCHIILVPIADLYDHEQIVQTQVEWLKNNIINLGYFFRPILIAKNQNVILDGHHRVAAMKELGYTKIPCVEIEYVENDDIRIGTWFPIYTEKRDIKFPSEFEKIDVEWKNLETFTTEVLENPDYGFLLKTAENQFIIKGTQQEIFTKFLAYFNPELFEYSKTLDNAFRSLKNRRASFILTRKPPTKQEVVETARSGKPFAPKTTRHILSFKYQDIQVPLKNLI